jgi:hypothetical protein
MFKKNTKHQQPALISAASELPEKQLKLLKGSWADTFYQELFCRIDEESFASLYSEEPSRPNVPVNVLVGLEVLKAGFGWSDAELYENFCFNLQVRYALGYDRLGDGDFAIRTIYNFRERLSKHYINKGINIIEQAFEQITDAQIVDLKVRTGIQRMDSTQIASNIVSASRLRLLVEAVQRMHRILSETDQARLAENFAPYVKGTAGHYTYRVKGKEANQEHLQQVGKTIHILLSELKKTYAKEKTYQVLKRIFAEHFNLIVQSNDVYPKENQELSSSSLQSVDDLEASYRTKGNHHYKGYVANITETCDPENDLQLIVKVQVEPNTTDDAKMLNEVLPELDERTDLEVMYVDGGYNSEDVDNTLADLEIDLVQTAIRGSKPAAESLGLEEFQWEVKANGQPQKVTCPQEVQVSVIYGRTKDRFLAYFNKADCDTCPISDKCPAQPLKRRAKRVLRFSKQEINVARRRQLAAQSRASGQNLRAAVESTVRSVKHPFRNGKVPVRGKPRMSMMIIGSAAMSNVRRIQRYLEAKREAQKEARKAWEQANQRTKIFLRSSLYFFVARFWRRFCVLYSMYWISVPGF